MNTIYQLVASGDGLGTKTIMLVAMHNHSGHCGEINHHDHYNTL